MIEKLILGTAGLGGLPYGREGRVVEEREAKRIFQRARELGIEAFDTAPAYGNAERWLGEFLRDEENPDVCVFTKNNGDRHQALQSIKHLKDRAVLVFHNWNGQFTEKWIKGATVYDTERDLSRFKIVQVPWSAVCQTPMPENDKISYVLRSVFLQGTLCDMPHPMGERFELAHDLAKQFHMTLGEMSLVSALRTTDAAGVVIGASTIDELEACAKIANKEMPRRLKEYLPIIDMGLCPATDPRTWKEVA